MLLIGRSLDAIGIDVILLGILASMSYEMFKPNKMQANKNVYFSEIEKNLHRYVLCIFLDYTCRPLFNF